MNPVVARVLKRLHYPLDVILTCVRCYVSSPLGLRHLEDMMAERGVWVDHSTVHRWAIELLPVLEKAFRRRKRPVGKSWRMDETYIRVKGEWRYLYRAVDKDGSTIDFLLPAAHRDKTAARRYFEKSIAQNGVPETVTVDKSGATRQFMGYLGSLANGPCDCNARAGRRRVARQADPVPIEWTVLKAPASV
nr:IS6 family transposase [Paraburkholderia sp. RAU2J]